MLRIYDREVKVIMLRSGYTDKNEKGKKLRRNIFQKRTKDPFLQGEGTMFEFLKKRKKKNEDDLRGGQGAPMGCVYASPEVMRSGKNGSGNKAGERGDYPFIHAVQPVQPPIVKGDEAAMKTVYGSPEMMLGRDERLPMEPTRLTEICFCASCGGKVSSEEEDCPSCGKRILRSWNKEETLRVCGQCMGTIPLTVHYCPFCGKKYRS